MKTPNTLETIDLDTLTNVTGGAGEQPKQVAFRPTNCTTPPVPGEHIHHGGQYVPTGPYEGTAW